jgi:N6-adenosine-specific RNA methylase IME4
VSRTTAIAKRFSGGLVDARRLRVELASCRDVNALKKGRDLHAAAADFSIRQKRSAAEASALTECVRLYERRLGDVLGAQELRGRPKKGSSMEPFSLSVLGITKQDSHRWQAVARLPDGDFEAFIAACRSRNDLVLLSDLLALGRLPDGERKTVLTAISSDGAATTTQKARSALKELRHAERTAKIVEISKGNAELKTDQRFPVLLADPPWRYEHVKTDSRAIENQYPTMELDAICALPVGEVCTDDAVLFLWATSPKLDESLRVVREWGFTYRTCMVWVKTQIGMGYYARQQHELLLICTRGEPPVPLPENRPASVITAGRGEHSRKPVEFYEAIERMYPEFSKLEMFCRKPRDGWTAWGNQSVRAA